MQSLECRGTGQFITKDLTWSTQTRILLKWARQRLFPLRWLKRFGMGPWILNKCYSWTLKSTLTGCITACYGKCTSLDRKALKKVVRTA